MEIKSNHPPLPPKSPHLSPLGSLLDDEERNRDQEGQHGGDGELVSDVSHAVLQAGSLHELLVLVTLDGGEEVSDAGGDEGGPGEVELLDGGQDDSSDDNGEAQPLGLGDLLAVDELGQDGGEGGLGGLDNLGERHGSGGESEDGSAVGPHGAEGDGEHLDDVVHVDGRPLPAVGGDPHEETVEAADAHLQTRDGHGEAGLSTGSPQRQLVSDVVVVVAEVPEEEVRDERNVEALQGRSDSTAGSDGNAEGKETSTEICLGLKGGCIKVI